MNTWLRFVVILMTVGGGFSGFVANLQFLFESSHLEPGTFFLSFVALGLYGFVILSGLIFVQDSKRLSPLVAAFVLQIPSISAPAIVYRFTAGLDAIVAVAVKGPLAFNLGFDLRLGARWQLSLSQQGPWSVGVNVVALFLVILLCKANQSNILLTDPRLASHAPARQEAVVFRVHE